MWRWKKQRQGKKTAVAAVTTGSSLLAARIADGWKETRTLNLIFTFHSKTRGIPFISSLCFVWRCVFSKCILWHAFSIVFSLLATEINIMLRMQ